MATSRHILRAATTAQNLKTILRPFSTAAAATTTTTTGGTTQPSHHSQHQRNHQYLEPCDYLGSWVTPKDPKEAEAQLAQLRRDYAKKVKAVRKEYIQEMELERLEKQRKDEVKREALRIANEERKAAKAAKKKAEAAEREAFEEEFRKTLLKERQEKLECWRMREKHVEEKKTEKKELLRRQSSMWIDEAELDKKIMEAIVDTTPL